MELASLARFGQNLCAISGMWMTPLWLCHLCIIIVIALGVDMHFFHRISALSQGCHTRIGINQILCFPIFLDTALYQDEDIRVSSPVFPKLAQFFQNEFHGELTGGLSQLGVHNLIT